MKTPSKIPNFSRQDVLGGKKDVLEELDALLRDMRRVWTQSPAELRPVVRRTINRLMNLRSEIKAQTPAESKKYYDKRMLYGAILPATSDTTV